MAVGYDDAMKIKNTNPEAQETTGALLIRNSWGPSWGLAGYGWMPYDYVTKGIAQDLLLPPKKRVKSGLFSIGTSETLTLRESTQCLLQSDPCSTRCLFAC